MDAIRLIVVLIQLVFPRYMGTADMIDNNSAIVYSFEYDGEVAESILTIEDGVVHLDNEPAYGTCGLIEIDSYRHWYYVAEDVLSAAYCTNFGCGGGYTDEQAYIDMCTERRTYMPDPSLLFFGGSMSLIGKKKERGQGMLLFLIPMLVLVGIALWVAAGAASGDMSPWHIAAWIRGILATWSGVFGCALIQKTAGHDWSLVHEDSISVQLDGMGGDIVSCHVEDLGRLPLEGDVLLLGCTSDRAIEELAGMGLRIEWITGNNFGYLYKTPTSIDDALIGFRIQSCGHNYMARRVVEGTEVGPIYHVQSQYKLRALKLLAHDVIERKGSEVGSGAPTRQWYGHDEDFSTYTLGTLDVGLRVYHYNGQGDELAGPYTDGSHLTLSQACSLVTELNTREGDGWYASIKVEIE